MTSTPTAHATASASPIPKPAKTPGAAAPRARVMLVEDDPAVRCLMREFLGTRGFDVEEAASCGEAEAAFARLVPDAVLADYQMPDGNALDLLRRLQPQAPDVPIVVMTGHASIDLAVRAIQAGAQHFLTKPLDLAAVHVVLRRVIEQHRVRRQLRARQSGASRREPDPFLGSSAAIRALEAEAHRALETESPVLIFGETGSGKGALAAWLHALGTRAAEPFVDLNCAGLSRELLDSELFGYERGAFTGAVSAKPGLLEVAHRGTVFLDEIGDMDAIVQAKLLKVLEDQRYRRLGAVRDRQVDVRLIAATHRDLAARVRDQQFREDLYYRLSVIPLRVPALRDRAEDIPVLARHLLMRLGIELGRGPCGISEAAERLLVAHAWPGNIRELRNVLERALLRAAAEVVEPADLALDDMHPSRPGDSALTLAEVERRHIENVLEDEDGHVERAAKRLAIPRSSLYQKLKQMGLRASRRTSG